MSTRAVILAGGEGTRLGVLTAKRTKPAVPFAGKYRIIDFSLSNCVNSKIFDVMIITQYLPQSLIHHIGSGGPWDLNREFTGGVKIFTPFKAQGINWFSGTADAVLQNLNYILSNDPTHILILSGDHVFSMNFEDLIAYHEKKEADVTICTYKVPKEQASRFGVVALDSQKRVIDFNEKPENPKSNLVNMGIYLFNAAVLKKYLMKDSREITSQHDFGKNIIPSIVKDKARIFAYPFKDYWVDVGTIQSYWKAHMDLLSVLPGYDIRSRNWVIHTRSEERPPSYIHPGSQIQSSLICDGCVIESEVLIDHCVLSPGVLVKKGSQIRNSVILTDTTIEEYNSIHKAIIDKHVFLGKNSQIGSPSKKRARISMIGKNSVVPDGTILDDGGMIGCDVMPVDYESNHIHFGDLILSKGNNNGV